jgi:hypothetical protein
MGFNIRNHDTEDLAQMGCIALIKGGLKYKIGANAKSSRDFSINAAVDDSGIKDTEFVDCLEGPDNLEEDFIKKKRSS